MPTLPIRRLLIDLETPVPRHWCGGDAFLTALFNALSMSFPVGEQFFIDAVRQGAELLPPAQRADWDGALKGFIGQEATHRHIHGLFNAQIAQHGLVNHWAARAQARMQTLAGRDPRHALAATAAYEHFTALLAEWLLAHPEVLAGTQPRLRTMWLWHSAEEAEHKSSAFDLYQAVGGDLRWRRRWMWRITLLFFSDALRQTLNNLHHDGTLWRRATWRSAAVFLLSRDGLLRANARAWRAYFRPHFHPAQQHSDRSATWLSDNAAWFQAVHRS